MIDYRPVDSASVSLLESAETPDRPLALPIFRAHSHSPNHQLSNYQYIPVFSIQESISATPQLSTLLKDNLAKNACIVSLWGEEAVGKKVVADVLVSMIGQQPLKGMEDAQNNPGTSGWMFRLNGRGKEILLLDWTGHKAESGPMGLASFLLMYFLSSIIIYNIPDTNNEEAQFDLFCDNIKDSLDLGEGHLTKPKLVLVCEDQTTMDLFAAKAQQTGLFCWEVSKINLSGEWLKQNEPPPPSSTPPLDKKLLLTKGSFSQLKDLRKQILKCTPKLLNKTPVVQSLGLFLRHLLESLNKNHQLDLDSIWTYWLQIQRVADYNSFVVIYFQQMEEELIDDNPSDEVSLMLRLRRVRSSANTRFREEKLSSKIDLQLQRQLKGFTATKERTILETFRSKVERVSEQIQHNHFNNCSESPKEKLASFLQTIGDHHMGLSTTETAFTVVETSLSKLRPVDLLETPDSQLLTQLKDRQSSLNSNISKVSLSVREISQEMRNYSRLHSFSAESLKVKEEQCKRSIEETYYMNKALWQSRSERESTKKLEEMKIREYYEMVLVEQQQSMDRLRENSAIMDMSAGDRLIQSIKQSQQTLKQRQQERQSLQIAIKAQRRWWRCCW